MKIAVFFDSMIMGNFHNIVNNEILSKLNTIKNRVDHFCIGARNDVENYEFPTLEKIHKFAKENRNYAILYVQSKGVSHTQNKQCISDWRECMLYWLVEEIDRCLIKISEGNDVVGVKFLNHPAPHFQGNFWWSTSKHIRELCTPRNAPLPTSVLFSERHRAEFWILSKPCKYYEIYDYLIDPYSQVNPRKNYVK